MTTMMQDIDYKNNYFEYPELSRIHGEPSMTSLLVMRNEIRSNAMSVQTTLGGGKMGYLGLVCNQATYLTIPDAEEFQRPGNPGTFRVQGTPTAAQLAQQKADWEENMRLFREVNAVERSLVQQIVAAVDKSYLKSLRNNLTKKINKEIPEILNHLFNSYGKISPADLVTMKKRVQDYDLDPTKPIDILLSEIDDLADICDIAKNAMTRQQKIEMAYVIIWKTKKFKTALQQWNRKTDDDKTWSNFKSHMIDAQQDLRDTGDLIIKDAMDRDELVHVVTESIKDALDHKKEEDKENVVELQKINAVISKDKQTLELQLQELKKQVQDLMSRTPLQPLQQWPQQQYQWNPNNQQGFYNQQHYHQPGGNRRDKNNRNKTNKYCWTHGACDHWGKHCYCKAAGHVDNASFKDVKNGNTNGVKTRN